MLKFDTAKKENLDFEVRSLDAPSTSSATNSWSGVLRFLIAGIFFGIMLVKSEAVSWYRMQEMFRLQSFHMYGLMGSALAVGMLSVFMIRKFNVKTIDGEPIRLERKKFNKGNVYGGLLFGFGWAMTGACPGPIFALIGSGFYVIVAVLLSAIAGTWVYGLMQERLPH